MSSPVRRRPRRGRLSRQDCHEAANCALICVNERAGKLDGATIINTSASSLVGTFRLSYPHAGVFIGSISRLVVGSLDWQNALWIRCYTRAHEDRCTPSNNIRVCRRAVESATGRCPEEKARSWPTLLQPAAQLNAEQLELVDNDLENRNPQFDNSRLHVSLIKLLAIASCAIRSALSAAPT